jgi:hypothetical protein
MIKKTYLLAFLFLCACFTNLYAQKNSKADNEYEVKFLRTGVEGTIQFKIYSYGKKEDDCIENAKRNAIRAVIFDGIPGSDMQKPLVTEAGAEELYKDYFNVFFQKNGKYLHYVSLSTDGSIDTNDRLRVGKRVKVGVAVSVQKAALRKELESAGIIKKLGDGF